LREAIDASSSWVEVARHMGAARSELERIRGAARRLGLASDHLDDVRAATDPPMPIAPRLSRLPQAAELLASAWFILSGHQVSVPTAPCLFDLIASRGGSHCRVQVKTTTHRDRDGHWIVMISRRPYQRESSGGREPYDPDEIDAFFVMTGSGELFLIPVVAVAGRISIAVDCYRQYSVGAIGDLFRADDVGGARAG